MNKSGGSEWDIGMVVSIIEHWEMNAPCGHCTACVVFIWKVLQILSIENISITSFECDSIITTIKIKVKVEGS